MSDIYLAQRINGLNPSPTLRVAAQARKMKEEGKDIIFLSIGEPDFDTPFIIKQATISALESGMTKYLPTPGWLKLREVISEHINKVDRISSLPTEIIVSSGAKQSLFNAFMVLLNEGDEVLTFSPYWPTYKEQVFLAGGRLVEVPTLSENGFVPDLFQLRAHLTSKTKVLLLNYPNNPTGCVYSKEVLQQLGQFAVENNLWIISDEIYRDLIYESEFTSICTLGSDIAKRTIIINGCSKAYAMTGWRIGYAHASFEVVQAMSKVQDQVTSHATSFAQAGAYAAYKEGYREVSVMREEYNQRRKLMTDLLNQIPEINVSAPEGAFYIFVDMSAYIGKHFVDDIELSEALLEKVHVSTVPGTFFGGPNHLRLSYTVNQEDIKKGIERIYQFLISST